jgi:hypothetical protein
MKKLIAPTLTFGPSVLASVTGGAPSSGFHRPAASPPAHSPLAQQVTRTNHEVATHPKYHRDARAEQQNLAYAVNQTPGSNTQPVRPTTTQYTSR